MDTLHINMIQLLSDGEKLVTNRVHLLDLLQIGLEV